MMKKLKLQRVADSLTLNMAKNYNFSKSGQLSEGLQDLCDNNNIKNTLEEDDGSQINNKVSRQTDKNNQVQPSSNVEKKENCSNKCDSLLFYNNECNSVQSIPFNGELGVPSDCHSQGFSEEKVMLSGSKESVAIDTDDQSSMKIPSRNFSNSSDFQNNYINRPSFHNLQKHNSEQSIFNGLNCKPLLSRCNDNDKITSSPKYPNSQLYIRNSSSSSFNKSANNLSTSTSGETKNLSGGSQKNYMEASSDKQQQTLPVAGCIDLNEKSSSERGSPEINPLIKKQNESEVSSELTNITESSQQSDPSSCKETITGYTSLGKNIIQQIPSSLRRCYWDQKSIINTSKENLGKLSKHILETGSVSVLRINKYEEDFKKIHSTTPDKNSLKNVPLKIAQLSDDIWQIYMQIQQSPAAYLNKLEAWKRLYVFLKNQDNSNELFMVGSSVSGLSLKSNTLDLCLLASRDGDKKFTSFYNAKFKLEAVRIRLKRFEDIKYLEIVRGRVPLLKFTIKIDKEVIPVNMACNTEASIINSQLLNAYANCDNRVRPLVCIIKKWVRYHHINNPMFNTFSSYALTLLVINFLQHCKIPVIPIIPLPNCQNLEKYEIKIFDTLSILQLDNLINWQSSNTQTLGELLIDFFFYCSYFNFNCNMVSIRMGGNIVKLEQFNSRHYIKRDHLIYIEDPVKRTNASCAIHDKTIVNNILALFKETYNKIIKNKVLSEIFE